MCEQVIEHTNGFNFLETINQNTVDLILTDPPYIISRDTGMDKHKKHTDKIDETNGSSKTEDEWIEFVNKKRKIKMTFDETQKKNFLKYGSIYGKKYSVQTDYQEWDQCFTWETLKRFLEEFYKKLKTNGTLIIFFDLWKITIIKDMMEEIGYKQIRFIEWIKTNPQPLNSKTNYLTNCREIALCGVKKSKPTFNSSYDNAVYEDELYKFPLQGGKNRFHPTQKSLKLFEELIKKHSNEGDFVVDTFLGSGTTAIACKNTNRNFKGCDIDKEFVNKAQKVLDES